MKFFIDLNRILSKYKWIIWLGIVLAIIFALILFQSNRIKKKIAQSGNSSISNNTTISENNTNIANNSSSYNYFLNNIDSGNKTEDEITKDIDTMVNLGLSGEKLIEVFISLCNGNELDYAYNMLSDDCKEELYPTKKDFINKYYNIIFTTSKQYKIENYKNNTYKVNYSDEKVSSGVNSEYGSVDYITIDSNTGRLNISEFIGKKNLDKSASNSYVSVNVFEKDVYLNYEIYKVKATNNTKANMYLNNINNSNLYIKNSSNVKFNLANDEYLNEDYYIASGKTKNISLKFYRTYDSNNDTKTLELMDIVIENVSYYDSNDTSVDTTTGEILYANKATNYPTKSELIIQF